jgi:hypothetical protein
MLTSARFVLAAGLCSTLFACAPKVKPPPPDCTPLDPTNKATPPDMLPDGGYPEMINIVDMNEGNGLAYSWADGEGYVLAPVEKVWEALQQPGVVADRRQLETTDGGYVITKSGFDKTCDWSFILQSTTNSANLGFSYLVQWRGAHTAGSATEPTAAIVCGDLTQSGVILGGTDAMSILSDSIILTTINENVTKYAAIRHRGPLEDNGMVCHQFVQDVFNSVVAFVHGQPLPPDQN